MTGTSVTVTIGAFLSSSAVSSRGDRHCSGALTVSLVSIATGESSSYSAPREVSKGIHWGLKAAVATAAAPAITKISVAAVRKVEGMMAVGRQLGMNALLEMWSIVVMGLIRRKIASCKCGPNGDKILRGAFQVI